MAGWVRNFTFSCVGLLAFVYLALWAFNGFHGIGLGLQAMIALTLGTILTAGLGVGFTWIALVLPGWHAHLERLDSLLSRGSAQDFGMPRWRELQAIYLEHYKLEGVMLDPPPGHDE